MLKQMIFIEPEKKGAIKLVLGEKEYEEIQILTEKNELIASITDEDIIEKNGYKVVCVPANS